MLQQQAMLNGSLEHSQLSFLCLQLDIMRGILRQLKLSFQGTSLQLARTFTLLRNPTAAGCPKVTGPRLEVNQLCEALGREGLSMLGPERILTGALWLAEREGGMQPR